MDGGRFAAEGTPRQLINTYSTREVLELRFRSTEPVDISARLDGVAQRVEVLPFHQMGRFKWEKLGLEYTLDGVKAPSNELAEETCRLFRAEGLNAD